MKNVLCRKCGKSSFHVEAKGNNTGLYCNNCGAWQKWLSKDELRWLQSLEGEQTQKEREPVDDYIKTVIDRLQKFVSFLDKTIDEEMMKLPLSPEDAIRKSSYCLALERDKNAILNIIEGREFDDLGE